MSTQHTQSSTTVPHGAFIRFLATMDRRWIFLAMMLAVGMPILLKLRPPESPGPLSNATFAAIEHLPAGSRVLLSFDYDPASEGELQPMANAFVHHCASKGHKLAFMALWPLGAQKANETVDNVLKPFHPEYKLGVDYCMLGYKAGNEGVIKVIVTDLLQQYSTDASGTPLGEVPMLKGVSNIQAFDLILNVSAGYPGAKEWAQYATSAYPDAFSLLVGTTGVQSNQLYPYYPTQMKGMLVAIKGAAEYEVLVNAKYGNTPAIVAAQRMMSSREGERASENASGDTPESGVPAILQEGQRRMGPQLIAHLLMVTLIVLGNVVYFATRSKGATR